MKTQISRRNWLKSSALFATGLAVAPTFVHAKSGKANNYTQRTWERNLQFPPDITSLRARLLANENPYGPSPKAIEAIAKTASMGNRYGHSDAAKLKEILAEKEGVTPDHIMLGPGSTDMLEKTAIVQFKEGGNVVSADPAYMSLIRTAMSFGAEWKSVPLTKDWAHDLDEMEKAVDGDTKLVYICNPNNPTGTLTDPVKMKKFCASVSEKAPIFVDEAYMEFLEDGADRTMVPLVKEGKNVMVCRTFSKIHGMAGLRVGYMVAPPETLEGVRKMVRSNMGLSVTSISGALASIQDEAFQKKSRVLTAETREFVAEELTAMGITYIPSYTSFMMFPLQMEGDKYLEKMFAEGIGVRVFQIYDEPWCRVSMGTLEEMSMFTDSLKKVIG